MSTRRSDVPDVNFGHVRTSRVPSGRPIGGHATRARFEAEFVQHKGIFHRMLNEEVVSLADLIAISTGIDQVAKYGTRTVIGGR